MGMVVVMPRQRRARQSLVVGLSSRGDLQPDGKATVLAECAQQGDDLKHAELIAVLCNQRPLGQAQLRPGQDVRAAGAPLPARLAVEV